MNEKTIELIKHSNNKVMSERKEYSVFGKTFVFVKDPLPPEVDLTTVLQRIEEVVPYHCSEGLDSIYIGQFPELNKREVTAVYMDGSIYVTNEQDNNDDMVDDIIHEIAHCLESYYGMHIYSDGFLEREFIEKRKKMLDILGLHGYNVDVVQFLDVEYSNELDYFLYKGVGYDKLNLLSINIFPTAYSITSLREYFAVGFEEFLYGDDESLKQVSPVLYDKVKSLVTSEM